MIALDLRGGEDSLFTKAKLAAGAVSSILRDSDFKKVEALRVEEALALSLQGTVSVCRAPSFACLVVVLMLFTNSFLFLGRRLLILRIWRGGLVRSRALLRRRGHTRQRSPP